MSPMAHEVPKERPPALVQLVWEHDLVFAGHAGTAHSRHVAMTLDSASAAGPSPMQTLAFALTGCMAMDVVHVIRKGRYDLRGLKAELSGTRATEDPHRFTAIALHFDVTGDVPDEKVARAIELSKDKYCSVWHSMRTDIALSVSFTVTRGL
jgi:putative redox protein